MRGEPEISRRDLLTRWYVFHLELGLKSGGDSTESIGCVQGQAEGLREQLARVPICEGIPQDVLESFRAQENQEGLQDLCLIPVVVRIYS